MGRDELHCWLVARDSPMPWDVVHNRAYDGQPPLWYLLLWVLQRVTRDPRAMQVAHVLLATGVVWVFASRAPFGRPLRALFPFGYFLAYEYVALSRCYGLALLLALLLCDNHPRRFERPVRTSLLLVALALTTTVSTVVAAAYTAVLLVAWVGLARRREPVARRAWIPIAAGAAAFVAAALCAWPPADSTVAHVWPLTMPDDFAPTRLIVALLPIPRPYFYFWNSNALLGFEPFRHVAVPVSLALAAWLLFVLSRRREAAILFGVGLVGLMALFGLVYGGDVRHHGFLFVLFVMGGWLAKQTPASPDAMGARWERVRDAALTPTLALVLLAHVAGTPVALGYEYAKVFSSGGRAADVLRAQGLDRALLVAEMDYPATAVLGQLGGDAFAYSPRTAHTFSFVRWTRARAWDPSDQDAILYAAALGASRGEDAVLLMNRPLLPDLIDGHAVVRIAELYDSMIQEENFYIYRVARNTRAPLGVDPKPEN
jgi:hypothetical protein